MPNANKFEPILCFSRNPMQTPEDVFDMLQERMITMLGCAYSEKGLSLINWTPASAATYAEADALSGWQTSSVILDADDFDRLGEPVNLSMADVLGTPRIDKGLKKEIESQLNIEPVTEGLDPVTIFIALAAFEYVDEIAKRRKTMSSLETYG